MDNGFSFKEIWLKRMIDKLRHPGRERDCAAADSGKLLL